MESKFTQASLKVARTLSRAFGHGWACDQSGPSDSELLRLGIAGAVKEWERRLDALDAEEHARDVSRAEAEGDEARVRYHRAYPCRRNFEWRGLAPALTHRSASGTVRWSISPSGAVTVAVHERGVDGPPLWTISVSQQGVVSGGMTPGAEWPSMGWERDCAERVCRALRVPIAWVTPLPPPPRPLVSKEALRRF